MQEVAAYSTVAMTLGLVVARPRLSASFRLSPAMAAFAGVLVMVLFGAVRPHHGYLAAVNLWSPFVAIGAIMVMTEVALRVGLLDWWARLVEDRASSTRGLFALVFALGIVTSTTLNNDAAILLLTPLVVALVRRRYPDRPAMVVPFAFAVFMSAGVAALPVSNPMNMVVADFSGIAFNDYALHMAPVALGAWAVTYLVLRWLFRRALVAPLDPQSPAAAAGIPRATGAQIAVMVLLGSVLIAYSVLGYFGGPVWAVASSGALVALVIARRTRGEHPLRLIAEGVCWETLAFLLAVLILSLGLLEVGLVDRLTGHYAGAGLGTIGVTSALGSALLNNHPMSHLNMMALDGSGTGSVRVLAALVGGDLGPRLLPMGSLAGLLWIEMLRRQGVAVSLRQFVMVGAAVTLPALAISLAILALF